MLSKGLRDEENRQMNKLFNELQEVEFLPEYWELQQRVNIDRKLREVLGLSLEQIEIMESPLLLLTLKDRQFSFENFEQLGDILFRISAFEPEAEELQLINHSIAFYEYVLNQSGIFDFKLERKIKEAKEAL